MVRKWEWGWVCLGGLRPPKHTQIPLDLRNVG